MKRVEANGQWSLFCPNEAPGLHEVWGEEFEELYEKYEKEGRARKTIEAQKLWYAILEAQIETGGPFMCYKDSANCECFLSASGVRSDNCLQPSLINRTWVPSNPRIFAQRSLSTRLPTRLQCATSHP